MCDDGHINDTFQKSVQEDDCHVVPGHVEAVVDSGNLEDNNGFQQPLEIWDEGTFLELGKFHTGLVEDSEHKECSASDIFDDTFMSVRSGSCYSFESDCSRNSFFDDFTDTEQYFFEEALEDLPNHTLHNHSSQLESLQCTSFDLCDKSVNNLQSMEIRNSSRSQEVNTDLTLFHKPLFAKWTKMQQRNVSCNTDLSWLSGCNNERESQTMKSDTEDISVNTYITMADCYIVAKDTEYPEDIHHGGSNCCTGDERDVKMSAEALTRRAVKAELELLNTQRWVCRLLCWKTHQQSMEQCVLSRQCDTLEKAPSFNFMSVLAELDEKYNYMKQMIQAGVPLNSMSALYEHLSKMDIPTDNLWNGCITDIFQQCGDQEAIKSQKDSLTDVSLGTKELLSTHDIQVSEVSCSHSTEMENKGQLNAQKEISDDWFDVQESVTVDCFNEKLESCVELCTTGNSMSHENSEVFLSGDQKQIEISDDWFDVQESVTGIRSNEKLESCVELCTTGNSMSHDNSEVVLSSDQKEIDGKQVECLPPESGFFYVHVGNISNPITELELKSFFKSFGVFEVFLQELSPKCSYAVLVFKKSSDAQAAVRKMDRKELNGRKLKVRSIKVSDHKFTLCPENINQGERYQKHFSLPICEPKVCAAQLPPKTSSCTVTSVTTENSPMQVPYIASRCAAPSEFTEMDVPTMANSVQHQNALPGSALPFWMPPNSNVAPAIQHWSYQPFLTCWMTCNQQNNSYFQYPRLPQSPFSSPVPPQWYTQVSQQSHISAKPFPSQNRGILSPNRKSSAPIYINNDKSTPAQSKVTVPMSDPFNSTTSTVHRSLQTDTFKLKSTGNVPSLQSSSEKEKVLPKITTALKTTEAVSTSSKANPKSLGNVTATLVTRHSSVPTTATATTITTQTVEASILSSTGSGVTQTTSATCNLKSSIPLREPISIPMTVNIPVQSNIKTSVNVTPTVAIYSTTMDSFSAIVSPVTSQASSSLAPSVCYSLPAQAAASLSESSSYSSDEENWTVCPQLDQSSEFPTYITPHVMNLSSFTKIVKRLTMLHPESSRENIIKVLHEVRRSAGGSLSGWSINSIMLKASHFLSKSNISLKQECKIAANAKKN